jgi:hypothetical protein
MIAEMGGLAESQIGDDSDSRDVVAVTTERPVLFRTLVTDTRW